MSVGIYQNRDLTFTVVFNGIHRIHTTVTADPCEVSRWIDSIYRFHNLPDPLVGFEVEWRPAILPFVNPIALIQLCVGHRCLIFQILLAGGCAPDALRQFLRDARYTFLGVDIGAHVQRLRNQYSLQVSATTVDLRHWVADGLERSDLRQAELTDLTEAVMGLDVCLPLEVRMGMWDTPVLSFDQITFACVEAFLSYEIGRIIRSHQRDRWQVRSRVVP